MKNIQEAYNYILPPPKTAKDFLNDARGNIRQERKQLNSAQTRLELEQEDAAKAFERAKNSGKRREAQRETERLIQLERRRRALETEREKLEGSENRMSGIIRGQVVQNGLVTTMAYVNTQSVPVNHIQRIASRYEMQSDANKVANEVIETAMCNSSEEFELQQQQSSSYTRDEQERMNEMMATYDREMSNKFIRELPSIGGQHVSQITKRNTPMTNEEMMGRTQTSTRQLQAFLSQTS